MQIRNQVALVKLCAEKNVGFICMKGMSGGLVTNARIPFAFIRQFENAVPIWGVQRMSEIEEFISLSENPPALSDDLLAGIETDRKELAGAFCRSCGYCLPCPVGIHINNANRMRELLTRSPSKNWLSPTWRAGMEKIENCTKCGACAKKCPYGLKPYETLPGQLAFYRAFLARSEV
jgi:predicted aldo/keto reductase-like oxidoreductase